MLNTSSAIFSQTGKLSSKLGKFDFDLVICDLNMSIMSGLELCNSITNSDLKTRIILLSGDPDSFKNVHCRQVVDILGSKMDGRCSSGFRLAVARTGRDNLLIFQPL